ncbi:S1 domain-containing post-transcriptional regulator GSP13 [Bacillus thermotolerans]|uniref:SSU ribosomal protein S1p n=1 Tax=Bacillus thermotolerans TaxID=1221996 RepID=A0A0F5HNS7_BACTR|nr:S1 domain-containing post-transcriptional regulator GSP13 [Bacillus thermotolerans]KKB34966.1 SSU ribosomal protein S1p [Bacillus thermotolerans]KKB40580.1 SSU ribosomal protein S1p [Bacillus thermotolerans]KKB42000.1 SSU ribosomal protein S1p [Bacillus thermotolerans]
MANPIEEGQIITGKVTGIQPYGAFVALEDGKQGLVHISEVTHGFVKDIHEYLQVGEEVKVKVLSVNEEEGKISLSIRATEEAKPSAVQAARRLKLDENNEGFNTLKDKLQEWIKQSGENK